MAVARGDRAAGRRPARRLAQAGWLAVGVGLAACGDGATVVTPIVDVPIDDTDATASPLDEIVLTVAHARSARDLASQSFRRNETLEVPSVPFGDDLVIHMSGFVGASNVAYGRTCAITVDPDAAPPTPHLFFSRSVKFANLDIAPKPRIGGLGISYLGTALLVGGTDGTGGANDHVADVERFDPLTGELTMIGSVTQRDRAVHALVGTLPPRVVVLGGTSSSGVAKFIEVLDDTRIDRFDDFAELARVGLTATSLTDGRVIVIGGEPGNPPLREIDEITQNGTALEIRKLNAVLGHPRRGHTATRLGEDVGAPVLIAGGIDDMGALVGDAELFKPLSEELADPMKFAKSMNFPRHDHTATLMPDGSVLFIGGLDALGQPVRRLELFSVDAGFVDVGLLPDGAGVVDFTATTLPDGRILLTGGRSIPGAPPINTAYIARLDPLDGSVDVVATDHLAIARANHQAVALCDGTVLLTGGTPGVFPAERYNPPPAGRR